ncbi:hypothetical protein D4764_08G0002440, partial [Takifugu flavidus]
NMVGDEELRINFLALDGNRTKKSEQRIKKKGEIIREKQKQSEPCQICINTQKENSYYCFIMTHLVSLFAGEELGGVSVSDKITGLAKKNKQLCVEVEKEKTKCRQSNTRIQALEKQERETVRLLQERLAASELKASEQRNKIQFLQKELKVAHKVVISEVGKDIPFQKLLNCPVGFKGRAEEMQTLKLKVQQLEKRLKERTDQEETGVPPVRGKWTTVNNPHEERYKSKLEGIQKERRAAIEKLSADFEALKTEYNKLKQITDISRARNMCLTREMKTLTSQLSALRVKSEHDDELVEVLINQEKHLRELLIKANKKNSEQKDVVVRPAHTPINEEQPINIEQG